MKNIKILSVAVGAAMLVAFSLEARTITVDANGGGDFKSIDAALEEAGAGDTVRVMPGLYREEVRVRRGGTKDKPLVVESAVRGGAIVRGSEVWTNEWKPLEGHPGVFASPIDMKPFSDGRLNPYATTIDIGGGKGRHARFATNDVSAIDASLPRTLGQIFLDGKPVSEVTTLRNLYDVAGTWLVSPDGAEIWLHPSAGNLPLSDRKIEWSVRGRIFHAARRGLSHVVVRGFVFEHCANQGPFPQRGAVDIRSGYNWIVEHNVVRFAKTIGLAVGGESWSGASITDVPKEDRKLILPMNNIVRFNEVSDNGLCGIAAWNPINLRIYNNVVERNNTGCYRGGWEEMAGIKVHCGTTTVANNLVRDNEGHGIWFDTGFVKVRITGNAILNNRKSGIMFESGFGSALVDCNVIAYTRSCGEPYYGGDGIYSHGGSGITVAHNLLAQNAGAGVRFRNIWDKVYDGRMAQTSNNRYLNNIFYRNAAAQMIIAPTNSLSHGTVSEGNLYVGGGYPFKFSDHNWGSANPSNVWDRLCAADPGAAMSYKTWNAAGRCANLAQWRAVQGLDATSIVDGLTFVKGAGFVDTLTRDMLLTISLPESMKNFRGKAVAGMDIDYRGHSYPAPGEPVAPGPFPDVAWPGKGLQFSLNPFERPAPPPFYNGVR